MIANCRAIMNLPVRLAFTHDHQLCGIRTLLRQCDNTEVFIGQIGQCLWTEATLPEPFVRTLKLELQKIATSADPNDVELLQSLLNYQCQLHTFLDPTIAKQCVRIVDLKYGAAFRKIYFMQDVVFSLKTLLQRSGQYRLQDSDLIEEYERGIQDKIYSLKNASPCYLNEMIEDSLRNFCIYHRYSFQRICNLFPI